MMQKHSVTAWCAGVGCLMLLAYANVDIAGQTTLPDDGRTVVDPRFPPPSSPPLDSATIERLTGHLRWQR